MSKRPCPTQDNYILESVKAFYVVKFYFWNKGMKLELVFMNKIKKLQGLYNTIFLYLYSTFNTALQLTKVLNSGKDIEG